MGRGVTSSLKHSNCDAEAPHRGIITVLSVIMHTMIPCSSIFTFDLSV